MGAKRTWKRERFLLCITCLIGFFMLIPGCSTVNNSQAPKRMSVTKQRTAGTNKFNDAVQIPIGGHFTKVNKEYTKALRKLKKADALMANDNFPRSLRYCKDVLNGFPRSLGGRALLQMGLIYAHPENPGLDYEKAMISFQTVLDKYPESTHIHEAEIWGMFFKEMGRKSTLIKEIRLKARNLENNIREHEDHIAKQEDHIWKQEEDIGRLEGDIESLEDHIGNLENQIKMLKEIDLGIEEKIREATPK